MKRRNRGKKRISIYIIIGICFLFLFVIGIIYAQVSQTLFFTGTVRIKEQDIMVTLKNDNVIQEGTDRYRYNYTYVIKNNTNQGISSWKVLLSNMPTSSIEIAEWNHEIALNDIENGRVIFQNKSWNSYIESGSSVSVSFSFVASELINTDQIKISIYYGTINPDKPIDPDKPVNPDELTSLAINPTNSIIKVGDTLQLQAQKTPATSTATLTWASSHEEIATVSQAGLVTAKAEGQTTISVSYGTISATAIIAVEKADTPSINEKVTVTFEKVAAWANSIQYKITIANNLETAINSCEFSLQVPEGSSYIIWSSNCTNSGNTITCNNTIQSGQTYIINGQVDLPEGYDINNYINPVIYNIQVQ